MAILCAIIERIQIYTINQRTSLLLNTFNRNLDALGKKLCNNLATILKSLHLNLLMHLLTPLFGELAISALSITQKWITKPVLIVFIRTLSRG